MIQVGQTVGNYKITAKLGEGGMGVVYLAEHPVIGKKVAMKAIHSELSRNPEVVSRFMIEAKSVNQIGNEHIVDISDFGNTPDGEFYFVMEFLQGEALADRLKREHAFASQRALKIGAQVADALAASHEHGVIHRDLKPENIYLINRGTSPDFVKVLDFGLAKLTQGDEKVSHKTRTGSVMGTPYYMSPEQCEGRVAVDHRGDVYSLGVILFEMLTGRVPFGGDGYGEIIVKHITTPPPSPRAINPTLDRAVEAIVLRALAKNRDDRFQTMTDFRAAMLDPAGYFAANPNVPVASAHSGTIQGMPVSPADVNDGGLRSEVRKQPTTFRYGTGEMVTEVEPRKSHKGLFALAAVVAVAAGGAAFLLFRGGEEKPERPIAAAPALAPALSPVPLPAPPGPAPAATVKIAFHSQPIGAQVLRKDTNELLGETPFETSLPRGDAPVSLVFKKGGFVDSGQTVVPNQQTSVSVDLVAVKTEAKAEAKPRAVSKRGSTNAPVRTNAHRNTPRMPVDEDAVLSPSF